YASMVAGFVAGIGWYALGDWAISSFFQGVHPVWIGMSVNLVTMAMVTLFDPAGSRRRVTASDARGRLGAGFVAVAVVLGLLTMWGWQWVHPNGVLGMALFSVVLLLTLAICLLVRDRDGTEGVASDKAAAALKGEDQMDAV